ncbi:13692_t:CDS:1 [Funneliformis geosporum]|nr:13692_t:CDS:1 [Funneliformis geosporum]
MSIAILGTQITLWCFDARYNCKFKVSIGDSNDIDDLKEAIKEKRRPRYDASASDEFKLWRVNTDQTISEEILNDELEDTAKTIKETFDVIQGGNIRVVVRVPDTGESQV